MLTMNVELWPFGDKSEAKRLVTINLANVGRSKLGGYDYVYTIDEPEPLYGDPIKAEGVIMNYDRNASCVDMLGAILDDFRRPKDYDMIDEDFNTARKLRNKTI